MPNPAANVPESDEPHAEMPDAMQRDLRLLYGPDADDIGNAPRSDDAVLRQARMHFDAMSQSPSRQRGAAAPAGAPPHRHGAQPYRFRVPLAVAAGLVLAATVALFVLDAARRGQLPSVSAPPVVAGDVNADGKLDILDAYLLARRLRQSGTLEAQFDLTRDGKVDQDDVNELTAHAVRLRQPMSGVGS